MPFLHVRVRLIDRRGKFNVRLVRNFFRFLIIERRFRAASRNVHGQQVRAEALHLVGDLLRRALADSDERNDGGNADNDAEHREQRSHFVRQVCF